MNSNACIPGPNEHLVKYFGSVAVDIGTGVDTVQKAVSVSVILFIYLFVTSELQGSIRAFL